MNQRKKNNNRIIFVEPIVELSGLRDIKVASSGILIGSSADSFVIVRRKKKI
jgi:hypothetical protein